MAQSLPFISAEMTFTEFLIIYLSIGAPFGVYYFLSRRSSNFELTFLLKAVCVVFGWCFYAVYLIFRRPQKTYEANLTSDSSAENEIENLMRKLFASYSEIPQNDKKISFFQYREVIERYAGLTIAVRDSAESNEFENELFALAGRQNQDLQLANRCLRRKNLLRLKAHQIQAGEDFLRIFENSGESLNINFRENLFPLAARLVVLLNDVETSDRLNQIKSGIDEQNSHPVLPSKRQDELWNKLPSEQIHVMKT